MRNIQEIDITCNRYVYNRLHRELHASCSYCGWNRGCNTSNKYYTAKRGLTNYPSWKLVSRNRKQWMRKPPEPFILRKKGGRSNLLR